MGHQLFSDSARILAVVVVISGARTQLLYLHDFNLSSVSGMAGTVFDIVPKSPNCPACDF
jgi:hypothetical protein